MAVRNQYAAAYRSHLLHLVFDLLHDLWGLGFPRRHDRRSVMAYAVCVLCSTHELRRRCSFSFSVLRGNDFRFYLVFFSVASVMRLAPVRLVTVHHSHGFDSFGV